MLGELQSANKLLRAGAYDDAIKLYKNLGAKYQNIKPQVNFNIKLCERRMKKSLEFELEFGDQSNAEVELKNDYQFDYTALLNGEVGSSIYKLERKDYLNIKKAVKGVAVDPDILVSICTAITKSPFQVELYKLLLRFVKFKKQRHKTEAFGQPVFTCLNILEMCNSSAGWISLRKKLQEYIYKTNITDRRAKNLVSKDPSQISYKDVPVTQLLLASKAESVGFGTILLNEEKYIFDNLMQHYDWCHQWALIEGACLGYPERKVSKEGLSLDKTADLIKCFPDPDGKLVHIQHGWTKSGGEDAKSELRNRYLQVVNTDVLVVVDADEFYLEDDLKKGISSINSEKSFAVTLPQVHFWRTTDQFITGEYYDISHTRIYKNLRGMKYVRNHNFPELGGKFLTEMGHFKFKRTVDSVSDGMFTYREPKCYHMGFAKDYDDMKDKSDYYVNRGEKETRASTTKSRAAWFDGDLPAKCKVRGWGGVTPQALQG
jgi:hypothetical protein